MRVLYFGTYERDYPRNAQVISCLRRAGIDAVEHHVPVWEGREHKYAAGASAVLRLAVGEARLLRRPRTAFDVLVVGYPGHFDLPLAKRAARGRPVVFNALVSLADTFVEDRARFRRDSLAARVLERVDRAAFRTADLVVADTEQHARLFREVGARRVGVCFVGAEERLFTPGWRAQDPFTALFVGKLIPLHGIETILAAARLAPDVRFRIVGGGQLEHLLHDRPPNVEHVPWIPYERLADEYRRCGCALGIFGVTAKASRVIPNKVFQALACGAPVITADTAAIREFGGDAVVAVPPGDAGALAQAVHTLADDLTQRERVAETGLARYRERASEEILGARWRGLLESLR